MYVSSVDVKSTRNQWFLEFRCPSKTNNLNILSVKTKPPVVRTDVLRHAKIKQ